MQSKMEAYFQSTSDPHFFEGIQIKLAEHQRNLKQHRQEFIEHEKRMQTLGSQSFEEQDIDDSAPHLHHYDTGYGKLLLFFLQNICEGHNLTMKNFLREQPNNTKSFNLVRVVSDYTSEIERNFSIHVPRYFARKQNEQSQQNEKRTKIVANLKSNPHFEKEEIFVTKKLLPLSIQLFRSLNEFCNGAPENQRVVLQAKIFKPINSLLGNLHEIVDPETTKLKLSIFELLNSLVEGLFPEKESERNWIPRVLLRKLDFSNIKDTLLNAYHGSQKEFNILSQSNEDREDLIELCASIVIFLKTLGEFDNEDSTSSKVKSILLEQELSNLIHKQIRSIEIINEVNELERVYFRVPDICHNLEPKTQQQLLVSVKRDSPTDKIEDFVHKSRNITFEIEHQTHVRNTKYFSWIASLSYRWRLILQIDTFLINLLMIIFYITISPQPGNDGTYPVLPDNGWLLPLLYVLAALHVFFSFLINISFFWSWGPIIVFTKVKAYEEDKNKIEFALKARGEIVPPDSELKKKIVKYIYPIGYLFSDAWVIYHLIYLIASILGLFWFPIYSFHLLDVSIRSPQSRNVLKSITLNGSTLLLTAWAGLVVIYLYTIFSFWFFSSDYGANSSVPTSLLCNNLFQCFLSNIRWGVVNNGGGIGDNLAALPFADGGHYAGRFIFDVTFYFLIIIIFLNVIFGIILNTFAQLRSDRDAIDEDIRSNCFICSMKSDLFDRQALGFAHHIKYDHNMWNYLYFFIHLNNKDKDEYTAAEEYIYEQRQKGKNEFFPIGRAISIQKSGDDNGDS